MKDKKIGIIIPYFENQPVMRERLEWLLDVLRYQIREFEQEYYEEVTLVIVDDGCNAKWLDNYNTLNGHDDGIKIIHFEENRGVSAARNVGLDYLVDKCDYIGFLDGDDCISTDFIKEAYKLMQDDVDFIDCRLVQDGSEVFGTFETFKKQRKLIRNGVSGCFYKTELIGNKRFDEKLQIGEDEKWGKEVIDLNKHRKEVSMGVYIYNHGINCDSLTMRHARGEISEQFQKN